MNIFVLDEDPVLAAQYHNNKHCVKMILESLQMMVSGLRNKGATDAQMPKNELGGSFKGGYRHHPCTRWCVETTSNFEYLYDLAIALCKEYTMRYDKEHKCEKKIKSLLPHYKNYVKEGELTPFAIAISDWMDCRDVEGFEQMSAVEKYRQYYIHDKKRMAQWKRREKPHWWPSEKKTKELVTV